MTFPVDSESLLNSPEPRRRPHRPPGPNSPRFNPKSPPYASFETPNTNDIPDLSLNNSTESIVSPTPMRHARQRRLSSEDVMRVISESQRWRASHPSGVLPRLIWNLFKALVFTGPRWVYMLLRLLAYIMFLSAAWPVLAYRYLFSRYIVRNVCYGTNARNYLDIYLPIDFFDKEERLFERNYPVLVFISGGAWIIGYKTWTMLCGIMCSKFGIIFISPDYRNYPQGTVSDMLEDISRSMQWVFKNVKRWGGDVGNITLVGQSAGAHLSVLMMMEQAKRLRRQALKSEKIGNAVRALKSPAWPLQELKCFVGISGPYDLVSYEDHLHRRGLHRNVLNNIMEGAALLHYHSPLQRALRDSFAKYVKYMPVHNLFIHGDNDASVPYHITSDFVNVLRKHGMPAIEKIYNGGTHTDIILEHLMGSNHSEDDLMVDLVAIVRNLSISYNISKPIHGSDVSDESLDNMRSSPWLNPLQGLSPSALLFGTSCSTKNNNPKCDSPQSPRTGSVSIGEPKKQVINKSMSSGALAKKEIFSRALERTQGLLDHSVLTADEIFMIRSQKKLVPYPFMQAARYVSPF